jgi:hypothetical protein
MATLNFASVPTDQAIEMRARRLNSYIAVVLDANGRTSEFYCSSYSRRRTKVEEEMRESAAEWGATLLELRPTPDASSGWSRRRLLVIAGSTFVLSGAAIAATMAITLALEGAL